MRSKSHCATLFPLGPSCFHAFDRERLRNTLSRQEIVRLWKILEGRRGCLGMWNMEFGIEWDVKDVEQWCNLDLYLARREEWRRLKIGNDWFAFFPGKRIRKNSFRFENKSLLTDPLRSKVRILLLCNSRWSYTSFLKKKLKPERSSQEERDNRLGLKKLQTSVKLLEKERRKQDSQEEVRRRGVLSSLPPNRFSIRNVGRVVARLISLTSPHLFFTFHPPSSAMSRRGLNLECEGSRDRSSRADLE